MVFLQKNNIMVLQDHNNSTVIKRGYKTSIVKLAEQRNMNS